MASVLVKSSSFISKLETYLLSNYQNIVDIIPKFYLLIDQSFLGWYFNLSQDEKEDFKVFKASFINFCEAREFEYFKLASYDLAEFIYHYKIIKSNSSEILNQIENFPISTYLIEKSNLISKLYPNVCGEDALKMAISLIENRVQFKNANIGIAHNLFDNKSLAWKHFDELRDKKTDKQLDKDRHYCKLCIDEKLNKQHSYKVGVATGNHLTHLSDVHQIREDVSQLDNQKNR